MREIGAFEAKTHLSQLLDRADHGESFAITKHGRIVAFLTPASNQPKTVIRDVIAGIMTLQKKIAKRGVIMTLQEMNELKARGRK